RQQQLDAILMLEMVQREQAVKELERAQQQKSGNTPGGVSGGGGASKGKTDDGSNGSDASMAAAAAASAQASQRKRRGKAAGNGSAGTKNAKAEEAPVIPLFQASTLTEEQERDQAARLIVRGAESALDAVAKLFGAQLMQSVPRLWECVSVPLAKVYGGMAAGDPLTVRSAEVLADADTKLETAGQEVIDALRILQTMAGSIDLSLHCYLVHALPWTMSALMSKFAAVRHMAARTMAELCRVCTVAAMQPFIQSVLPSLGDTTMAHRRQGVAEAIYYIIQLLGEAVLPYVTFLMVPVLGRMSDVDEQTRLVCTNCFAQLLKLVPLEADIPDPQGISAELIEKREHERKFLAQLMDSSKLEPFKIPVRINATLRKYQQEGVDWLAFLDKYELHGVLCDDMGLGKTLQTICIIASDHFLRSQRLAASGGQAADCRPLPSLVICPPTLIGHWEQEIKHYTETLRPLCYGGVPAERRSLVPQIAANKADVVIMSYDVVRNDIEYLQGQNWNYCVLDEGHVIKNAKTKLTQAVKRVKARRRLILSGTPVQNNVIELWSLFDFLMPGFLGTERQFNELYGKPILASRDAKQTSQAHINGELALKALHKQVLPFLLRRMKEDVLQDLPPKIIQDYHCELSPLQKFLYEEFAKSNATGNLKKSLGMKSEDDEDTQAPSSEVAKKSGTHVFQALQYLRKLCNHPALVLTPKHPLYTQVVADLKARNADLHSLDIAPKMQALQDLLHQCGIGVASSGAADSKSLGAVEDMDSISANHRVLIFCQHKEMIERIEQDLFQRAMPSVTYMRVDGTVEARRRQEIVTQFNSDPSIDALLLTTHVGGLGLNLTGADTVIFVEHDYNPAMDLQAMDRAHRLGQTRVVNVYRLITRHTLEEKIMGLQAFKLHMANTIVNQQNSGLASMNTDQLLDLFNVSPSDAKDAKVEDKQDVGGSNKSISKALEGLEELWDSSQYEDEYNLDNFISSLQQ
ncbi:TATA-binding protein-associated factor mot1, partial [Linderina macrospora]